MQATGLALCNTLDAGITILCCIWLRENLHNIRCDEWDQIPEPRAARVLRSGAEHEPPNVDCEVFAQEGPCSYWCGTQGLTCHAMYDDSGNSCCSYKGNKLSCDYTGDASDMDFICECWP